uniref:uncharacterized protein LOC127068520 n=1 Tax=Vespula vulgaris TaxID=7454 RepID=UPI00223B766B|nr:uncharacterized protein LOC127068520 [Vespula vulgaris]
MNQKYIKTVQFDGVPNEELNWIIDIIIRYRRVTEFVNMLNNFSKITYLLLIFLAMFLIVFDFLYIFQLSSTLKNNIEIIEQIIYIIASIFTIYANFYYGQRLINHSNATFKELCQVPFYALSIRTQKLLLFALTRSMKPSVLSIGGFFVSSHEVFAGIMQKAFSFSLMYYSVQ